MKKFLTIVIIAAILVIAFMTNPNEEQHRLAVKEKLNSFLQDKINTEKENTNNYWEKAGLALGEVFGNVAVDKIIDNMISSNDYILFSTTKINLGKESKTIGIGAFGIVYISKKVDEVLKESMLEDSSINL